MVLRDKIRYARLFGVALAVPAIALLGRTFAAQHPAPLILVMGVGLWLYAVCVSIWFTTREQRRAGRLNEAEDYEGARRLIEELRAVYPASAATTRMFQLVDGSQLCLEGRHPEAVSVLSAIDPAQLKGASRPLCLNNLAWSLALSGNAADAVPRARECVAASEAAGQTTRLQRAAYVGTLGTALVLAGEADEGVRRLEEALALGGRPAGLAAQAFFLGEGMRALGRYDDAAKAYRRAIEEAPSTQFGQRASVSLRGLAGYRSS